MRDLHRCALVALGALAVVALLSLRDSFGTYSDFDSRPVQVRAGAWTADLDIPAECAGMDLVLPPIAGTSASDSITGTNANDLIFGLGGDDLIQGGNGSDCIVGGDGDDVLGGDRQYENGQDVLLGEAGADHLDGGNGKDLLLGGTGPDTLDGRNGNDLVYGESGADVLLGGNGTELLDGGASATIPDAEQDACTGGRAPEVYRDCELIDGVLIAGATAP